MRESSNPRSRYCTTTRYRYLVPGAVSVWIRTHPITGTGIDSPIANLLVPEGNCVPVYRYRVPVGDDHGETEGPVSGAAPRYPITTVVVVDSLTTLFIQYFFSPTKSAGIGAAAVHESAGVQQ